MQLIRFREDIAEEDGSLIWCKGNIYKILYETEDTIWLENDSLDNGSYGVAKSDLNSYCFIYNCNGNINANCQYCKYLSYDRNKQYCRIKKELSNNTG